MEQLKKILYYLLKSIGYIFKILSNQLQIINMKIEEKNLNEFIYGKDI